jgi:hypothetical protein
MLHIRELKASRIVSRDLDGNFLVAVHFWLLFPSACFILLIFFLLGVRN